MLFAFCWIVSQEMIQKASENYGNIAGADKLLEFLTKKTPEWFDIILQGISEPRNKLVELKNIFYSCKGEQVIKIASPPFQLQLLLFYLVQKDKADWLNVQNLSLSLVKFVYFGGKFSVEWLGVHVFVCFRATSH